MQVKYHAGNYEKAAKYYQTSYEILSRVLGTEHQKPKNVRITIGTIYRIIAQSQWGEDDHKALVYFKKALEICEEELGPEHVVTAENYDSIGAIYTGLDDCDKALEWYTKAVRLFEETSGANDPLAISTRALLDSVKERIGPDIQFIFIYQKH